MHLLPLQNQNNSRALMPGSRRGLVAPQNTFLDSIVRKCSGAQRKIVTDDDKNRLERMLEHTQIIRLILLLNEPL
ncbi:unnamed protein product [Adineta ricciae]|uniref:Uncharacterized protein n=1 Tax=Adineta ricciae TaxID=249248 RepID=A0A814YJ49_ADIRI|nr:unnamed protein product [Adineta ricciae]